MGMLHFQAHLDVQLNLVSSPCTIVLASKFERPWSTSLDEINQHAGSTAWCWQICQPSCTLYHSFICLLHYNPFLGGNPNSMIWTAPVIGRSCSVDHRPGHLGEWTAAEPRGNGRGLEVLRPGRIRAPPQHGWVQNLRYEIHFPANFREQEILFFFQDLEVLCLSEIKHGVHATWNPNSVDESLSWFVIQTVHHPPAKQLYVLTIQARQEVTSIFIRGPSPPKA